jgi:rhodanese-related sulfurtransferase/ABC-type phosphate/phosphonate transport system substrate-binding protein
MLKKVVFVSALAISGVASADLTLAIVRNADESYGDFEVMQRYGDFTRQVRQVVGQPVKVVQYQSAFEAAKKGKHGDFDIILAPSHTVASLLHAKFVPIAETQEKLSTVFVVPAGSKITSLADAKGARVAMPNFESLESSQARGEINLQNIRPKSYFANFQYHKFNGTTLFALSNKTFDMAVSNDVDATAWISKNGGKKIFETATAPLQAVAIKESLPDALKNKLQAGLLKDTRTTHLVMAEKVSFSRLGSILNTTPTQLVGAKLLTVAEGRKLIEQGVPVYDVRTAELYQQAHVPHAILNEYKEVSAKEIDFDSKLDTFDISKLPADKTKAFIMYCDGTSCWKSYKSTVAAINNGYTNVYWMRGGLPDWKDAGYPTEQ